MNRFGSLCHIQIAEHHMDTTQHRTTTINTNNMSGADPTLTLEPTQIRRRANDFDSQIRVALEEGDVRQVVRRSREAMVSRLLIS
jgi:hypothetical protein